MRSTETRAGERRTDCGVMISHDLEFLADEPVRITPFNSASVTIGGVPFTAIAAANYRWQDDICTDLTPQMPWAVVRFRPTG